MRDEILRIYHCHGGHCTDQHEHACDSFLEVGYSTYFFGDTSYDWHLDLLVGWRGRKVVMLVRLHNVVSKYVFQLKRRNIDSSRLSSGNALSLIC